MAQALYRKWRSRTFEEVVGQEHVTTTLHNALRDGRVAHAYLFSGPRGTGKTSTARILAKALNCEAETRPCDTCAPCVALNEGRMLDLIEIDAASNNSVDDVRELREKIGFRPSAGRYKVYIIDEVHMLSPSAFNALLKTLEEPPPHARFVLATTEPHRIPATVLSRCQRFDFRRIPVPEIAAHLATIAAAEGFQAEEAALHAIARSAQGGMRDAVSLLDQMTSYGAETISLEQVQQVLGAVEAEAVAAFVDVLGNKNIAEGLQLIHKLLLQGASLHEFAAQVIEHLRGVMLVQMVGNGSLLEERTPEIVHKMEQQAKQIPQAETLGAIKRFSEALQELKEGSQLPLELALVELVKGIPVQVQAAGPQGEAARDSSWRGKGTPVPVQEAPAASAARASSPDRANASQGLPAHTDSPSPAQPSADSTETTVGPLDADAVQKLREHWPELLKDVREHCGLKAEAALRSVKDCAIGENAVVLAFGNNTFAKNVISETTTKETIARILSEILAQQMALTCQNGDTAILSMTTGREVQEKEPSGPDPLVEFAVSELGAQVIDSN